MLDPKGSGAASRAGDGGRRPRALLSWSSGKDSAWALHRLRQAGEVEVGALLTTVSAAYARVSMHGVRIDLLEAQAAAARLPLRKIEIPSPCTNAEYEAAMSLAVRDAREKGFTHIAFGDLFLEDIRRYREERLAGTGLTPLFPLWGEPTDRLAREMIGGGLQATITCVDPRRLPPAFAGREWDTALLAEFPTGVDPCGERGEFHTFAHAGPMFGAPIPIARGAVVERDGFVFGDLTPAPATGSPSYPGTW